MSRQTEEYKMFKTRTIIHVIAESKLGIGLSVACDGCTAALYYLAYSAACRKLPLETITAGRCYQIGSVQYILEERKLLAIDDVGQLRKALEG